MASTASVIVASKKLGVRNFAEFRDLVGKNPGKYSYASVGVGTTAHLTMEMVADHVGSKMVHVPYRATPETLQAVMQGDVDAATVAVGTAISQIQAGSVVPLAITASERWPTLPDLPTIAEAGIPDMPVDSFVGLFLPAGVSKSIVDRTYSEVKAVIDDPQSHKLMMQAFYRPSGIPPEKFADVLHTEISLWRPVLAKLDLLVK
jgi:tripartite-type tricarboxylate transporter receptor subunit TctC